MEYYAESIFDLIKDNMNIEDGIHTYICTKNNVNLTFEMINYKEDITFTTTPILGNSTPDTQMLILKCHKNLTINSGVIITPQVRKKGFTIFCMGKLTNNGTISMTARGASAVGQNLYLYKDEFVPAIGATGGAGQVSNPGESRWDMKNGINGNQGTDRKTGGGGSGGIRTYSIKATTGRGGIGTSYSGGPGSGAATSDRGTSGTSGNGSDTGGPGGYAFCSDGNPWPRVASGGTGNNNGADRTWQTTATFSGGIGTGGLLIIFTKKLVNNSNIVSNGSNSRVGIAGTTSCSNLTGGASGGGSVNIFYEVNESNGTITAKGGVGIMGTNGEVFKGGNGGDGSVTLTKIDLKIFSSLAYNAVKEAILNNELINKIISFFE